MDNEELTPEELEVQLQEALQDRRLLLQLQDKPEWKRLEEIVRAQARLLKLQLEVHRWTQEEWVRGEAQKSRIEGMLSVIMLPTIVAENAEISIEEIRRRLGENDE